MKRLIIIIVVCAAVIWIASTNKEEGRTPHTEIVSPHGKGIESGQLHGKIVDIDTSVNCNQPTLLVETQEARVGGETDTVYAQVVLTRNELKKALVGGCCTLLWDRFYTMCKVEPEHPHRIQLSTSDVGMIISVTFASDK